jgi:VWFA-related protein
MVHQFTAETDLLLDALHNEGFDGYSASNQPVGAGPEWGPPGMRFLQLDGRIRQAINSMVFLGDRLSHMPGRKSLIWISDGFPSSVGGLMIGSPRAPTANYVTQIEKIVRALNSANIAVYSIAAQGLATGGAFSSLTPGGDTMSELSRRTGGTMFGGRNDLDAGIRAALEDINISYTLGFVVPENTPPGAHAIEVHTNRRGLVLRYRESYTLDAPPKPVRR